LWVINEQLHELEHQIADINLNEHQEKWNFIWGNQFSTKKLYNLLMGEHPTHQPILDIWKTCNIPRQKFFSWLLPHGKLNTKDMMTKKNFYVEFSECILW
jgi:hypothetical protein